MAFRTPAATAAALLTVLLACGGGETAPPAAAPAPLEVSAIDPVQVSTAGSAVVIQGSGFQPGATVRVGGGAPASATFVSATQLLLAAPPHAAGPVDVEVVNPDGGRFTLTAALTYAAPAAAPPPTLLAVAPAVGTTAGGATVTLTGADLHPLATATFGGLPAERLAGDAGSLTVRAPAHAAGAVEVAIQNPDGQQASLADAFTYAAPQVAGPVVQGIAPSGGPAAGGTAVTITGTGFDGVDALQVTFGGTPVAPSAATATSITVVTPAHLPGFADVTVRNADGQASTLAGGFAFAGSLPAPVILGLSPAAGPTGGGGLTILTGSGFVTGSTVSFGGTAATVVVPVTATSIAVVAPAHLAGPVDVRVANPDGQSVTAAGGYNYLSPAPAVLALNVRGGPLAGGTQVLAVGSGFEPGVTVSVGGLPASDVSIVVLGPGSQAVRFFTPAHAEGFAEVAVTNPDGQSDSHLAFHYAPPPAVSAISCAGGCGSVRRDDLVTISGSAFAAAPGEGVQVLFSSIDRPQKAVAALVSSSATQLLVQAPRLDPGLYTVVVTNFDGQYTVAATRLTYPAP